MAKFKQQKCVLSNLHLFTSPLFRPFMTEQQSVIPEIAVQTLKLGNIQSDRFLLRPSTLIT
jgi:hypothetical protein